MPTVSVIIPAYAHAGFILRTLASVFAQTFTDYEVIVVNDGSPDHTHDLLAPLAASGRITYFQQSNHGQSAARNRGIEAARGRYIAVLDDDDLWPPDKLEWQVEALDRDPSAVLAYGGWLSIDEHDRQLRQDVDDFPTGDVRRAFLEACWIISPGQALIRREALRALGGFDSTIRNSDDWDLYIRLAALGRFIYQRRPALLYRFHPGNASRNAVLHVRNEWAVMRKHYPRWNAALISRHLRLAAPFFLPNLRRCGDRLRSEGRYTEALHAYLHMLPFRLRLAFSRQWLRSAAACLLRRPPSRCAID